MRTTITIDPDNAEQIERLVSQEGTTRPLRAVINKLLRLGLRTLQAAAQEGDDQFQVVPYEVRLKSGWDLGRLGRMANELEAEHELSRFQESERGHS